MAKYQCKFAQRPMWSSYGQATLTTSEGQGQGCNAKGKIGDEHVFHTLLEFAPTSMIRAIRDSQHALHQVQGHSQTQGIPLSHNSVMFSLVLAMV